MTVHRPTLLLPAQVQPPSAAPLHHPQGPAGPPGVAGRLLDRLHAPSQRRRPPALGRVRRVAGPVLPAGRDTGPGGRRLPGGAGRAALHSPTEREGRGGGRGPGQRTLPGREPRERQAQRQRRFEEREEDKLTSPSRRVEGGASAAALSEGRRGGEGGGAWWGHAQRLVARRSERDTRNLFVGVRAVCVCRWVRACFNATLTEDFFNGCSSLSKTPSIRDANEAKLVPGQCSPDQFICSIYIYRYINMSIFFFLPTRWIITGAKPFTARLFKNKSINM